mgnify:CR=1 FL=1
MAERQLKLYAQTTDGGTKTTTTTISNVNPQATSATMKSFGQMLNAFTTNTYQKTDLVETTNVDTETVKLFPQPTINSTIGTISSGMTQVDIKTNSQSAPFGVAYRYENGHSIDTWPITGTPAVMNIQSTLPGEYHCVVATKESDNYYPTVFEVTVTSGQS